MIQVWSNFLLEKEVHNIMDAIAGKHIMEGPVLQEFQNKVADLLHVKHALGASSGTAALALALMSIGIKPGDEVIVPDLTFIATANAACILGAKVIVAPTEAQRPILDFAALDDLITDKTKAIMPVALNGRLTDSKLLKEKYGKRGIYIIEDACQAFLSENKKEIAGTQADIGCFSFGITKMVTTVQGGMVVTNNDELYEKMKIIKTQGMPSVFEGTAYLMPGFNFKLPDVLAAVGLGQLERVDDKILHMQKIDEMYREGLKDVEGIRFLERMDDGHVWMTDIQCDDRDNIRQILREHDIISRPLAMPIHHADYLEGRGNYANSIQMQKRMLYLPSGPDQEFDNVEKVIHVLKNYPLVKN